MNKVSGTLLRSRFSEANEIAITLGFGVLDSVLLV